MSKSSTHPTKHLDDLALRFKLIFLMTPFKNRIDLINEIIHENTKHISINLEGPSSEEKYNRVANNIESEFDKILHDPSAFSKMKKGERYHLTPTQLYYLCETLEISTDDFVNENIYEFLSALEKSSINNNWNEGSYNSALNLIYKEKPLLSKSFTAPTQFSRYNPNYWDYINHSYTNTGPVSISDKNLQIFRQILETTEIFNKRKRSKIDIKKIKIAATSDVYRVTFDNKKFFMKIAKRHNGTSFAELQEREIYFSNYKLENEDLFSRSSCLMPIPIDGKATYYMIIDKNRSEQLELECKEHVLAIYPYDDGILFGEESIPKNHLSEKGVIPYLTSLARNMARLHIAARSFTYESNCDDVEYSLGFLADGAKKLKDAYDTIFKNHEFSKVWNDIDNSRVINKAVEEYDIWLAARPEENKRHPVMYDLHPFNALFDKQEKACSVIIDYEGLSTEWLEEDALAFTTHRFVREYIRCRKTNDCSSSDAEEAMRLGKEMALAYREAGGHLPEDYENRIGCLIRIGNIGKFFVILHQLIRGYDKARRSTDVHDSEARKFLLFLRESEFFDPK